MRLPPWLQSAIADFSPEDLLVVGMAVVSVLLVAIAAERLWMMVRVYRSLRHARRLVAVARTDGVEAAGAAVPGVPGPAAPVFRAGLDRALGRV
ncbi:MAG: hypothetical protein D6798_15855, partial [Deltaproteobacteria bacterium]